MAKDLASRRRDLANLVEKYRQAPSEEKKKELLAEVQRLKARMAEMMRRMAELAKGLQDEHMNEEALAELAKQKDAMSGLDEVEKMLAKGDVEGAMKALDQLGNQMQDMLASLERTAGEPGKQNAELMKEMLAFKKQLEEVQAEQEEVARQTEAVKNEYRKQLAERMKQLDQQAARLEAMAAQAREELKKAEKGVTLRSEDDYAQARDRLADLEKALQGKDFDAALETARRSMAPMQRLAMGLEDEAAIAERYRQLRSKDPEEVRDAQKHAQAALAPARKVKDELERMFPDPRSVLPEGEQQKLGQLSKKQGELERKAGELAQKLGELAQKAPVFPPQAGEMLQGSQGHMREAQGQLAMRNPQRGHGEQRLAMDELDRFKRGLDEMAKRSQQQGGGGQGFPFPFGEEQGGREGEGTDASQEKVEIPGAEAYRVPDEFRKDLLEAMKQGTPEPYQGEVQRYYEELVK
jgi:archaellum component FlaC